MSQIMINLNKRKSQVISVTMLCLFSGLFINAVYDQYNAIQFCDKNLSSQKDQCYGIMLYANRTPIVFGIIGIVFGVYFTNKYCKTKEANGQ